MTSSSVIRAGIVAVLLSTTSAAFAADITIPEEPAPIAPIPIFTWTGFYVGIVGGYNWGSSDWSTNEFDNVSFNANGGNVGGTVGYNYQFANNVVLGLETDLSWSGAKGDVVCAFDDLRCETESQWFGTLRPRLGYAFDRFLPYITAGAAYGNVKLSARDRFDNDFSFSDSVTRFGWSAGVGVEYAFTDQWTAKIEYLHTDLGSDNFLIDDFIVNSDWKADGVRVGVNYKF